MDWMFDSMVDTRKDLSYLILSVDILRSLKEKRLASICKAEIIDLILSIL
jgi:hypothetical protein